jgi:hypothetical protein
MPPRRSARVSAAAERATSALSPLPLSVVLHIFSLLPVDRRLRCSEVCRGWRAVLLERSLLTALDLTVGSGVRLLDAAAADTAPETLVALLRCAAVRARGSLRLLHVDSRCTHGALRETAAANAGALRELHVWNAPDRRRRPRGLSLEEAEALLDAAPLLDVLAVDVGCDDTDMQAARRALRNEAPFGPLRVRHLFASMDDEDDAASVIALAADVAAHASLRGLSLLYASLGTAAALDAVVDAALARRMDSVTLDRCFLSPASTPALARLLGGGALTTLECSYRDLSLDAPAAAVLAAALRANSTLTSLTLNGAGVFRDAAAATTLLGALTGHASVQTLRLRGNRVTDADQAAVGASIGALVAANAPALTQLDVSMCALRDDGLRALFEAMPHNTHLRELGCSHNFISEPFAWGALLPAVRANTSLRQLKARSQFTVSAAEAERIVSRRAAA